MAVFLSTKTKAPAKWSLASASLRDAYSDFVLSHQAAQYSPATHHYYEFTTGKFIAWLEANGVTSPHEVTARYVRGLSRRPDRAGEVAGRGVRPCPDDPHPHPLLAQREVHGRAHPVRHAAPGRAPASGPDRCPGRASPEGLRQHCEIGPWSCSLWTPAYDVRKSARSIGAISTSAPASWPSGEGKGGKGRAAVCGATVRRELLKYRRTLKNASDVAPVFQARGGVRFNGAGLLRIFQQLTKRTGIRVSPHVCRRTFATLSALAGMPVPLLQAMLGHTTLTMTLRYIRLVPGDLLQAHRAHSPIDNLSRLK